MDKENEGAALLSKAINNLANAVDRFTDAFLASMEEVNQDNPLDKPQTL